MRVLSSPALPCVIIDTYCAPNKAFPSCDATGIETGDMLRQSIAAPAAAAA
jgi:hypothetical protein